MRYPDHKIIEAIRQGDDNKVISSLYTHVYPRVKRYILGNSGSEDEANDVFQESVMAFYKQVKIGKYDTAHDIGGFIYAVSRNKWINWVKRENRKLSLDELDGVEPGVEDSALTTIISRDRANYIDKVLGSLGEKCKELLTLSVFEKLTMAEIAKALSLKNENAAKTQNYKCKQKLVALIKKDKTIEPQLRGEY